MVMQAAFFKLAEVMPVDEAIKYLKEGIDKTYKKKGQNIVDMNCKAVDMGVAAIKKINVPEGWAHAEDPKEKYEELPEFIEEILIPMNKQEGDDLPVSAFDGIEDGTFPSGTAAYEKRGVAIMLPEWDAEKCIQCNQCSFVCPHAAIRPMLLDEEEKAAAPFGFITAEAKGKGLEGLQYRMQVSPLDRLGCGNCADICPSKEKALVMKPFSKRKSRKRKTGTMVSIFREKTSEFLLTPLREASSQNHILNSPGALRRLRRDAVYQAGDSALWRQNADCQCNGMFLYLGLRPLRPRLIARMRTAEVLHGPTPCLRTMRNTAMVWRWPPSSTEKRSSIT